MGCLEWTLGIVLLLFIFYKWSTAKYDVLRKRGILHEKPYPLIGTIKLGMLFGKSSLIKAVLENYRKFHDRKVYGVYRMREPVIYIRDPELIKKVCIKDFDSFPNHKPSATDETHDIIAKSLIMLKDRKWKEMRSTLSPSFTGSKMRLMFELVNECCIHGVAFLESELKASGKNGLELEMKDYFTRFTNDVIASTAFGIKVNSFTSKNNEFYTIGKSVTQFSALAMIKFFLVTLLPKVMGTFRVKLLDENKTNYFSNLVLGAMKTREEKKIIRPDMIQLLMEAKRNFEDLKSTNVVGEHAQFNDEDLLAQCLLFFIAGFDTVSTCLCFTAHELLVNADVQDRLYEEIKETERELDGKPLTYDVIMKMKYMNMVLSESLRKWPPAVITDRVCSTDYKLFDEQGNLVTEIKKGELILIPIVGIHRDSKYFANPEKFDPERFSDENIEHVNPSNYMPFGVGPRSCIGNRLALMETKALLYHMLLKFKIVPAQQTCKDLMDAIRGLQMQPKGGFWMKFVPRTN